MVPIAEAQAPRIECGENSTLIGCDRGNGEILRPGDNDLNTFVGTAITTTITILAIIAVLFIIKGGFSLIFSLGNDEKLKSARNTILFAIGGLLLAMFSYLIIGLVTSIQLFP